MDSPTAAMLGTQEPPFEMSGAEAETPGRESVSVIKPQRWGLSLLYFFFLTMKR